MQNFKQKLPHKFWQDKENQRKFLNCFADKHQLKKTSDWGKITCKNFYEDGGGSLLASNGNSLLKVLKSAFPDSKWEPNWFSKFHQGYWHDRKNQRNFLEEFSKSRNIKSPKDWGKITCKSIIEYGGTSLLKQYNGSFYKVLKTVYSEIEWKPEWFANIKKYGFGHWDFKENQRKFLDQIAIQYNIVNPNDWKRVTSSLVRSQGGQGLLFRYHNNLQQALQTVYEIRDSKQIFSTQSQQNTLKSIVILFPQK